jgi:plastocyanin
LGEAQRIAQEVKMIPNWLGARSGVALVAALAGLALAACGGTQASGGAPAAAVASTAAPVATPTAAAPVATTSVDIANFAFSPAIVTVKVGQTITWTNRDEDAHTVAITGAPVSVPLQGGDTYTHTFSQPGRYSYLCTIHPNMHGMVVVTTG